MLFAKELLCDIFKWQRTEHPPGGKDKNNIAVYCGKRGTTVQ